MNFFTKPLCLLLLAFSSYALFAQQQVTPNNKTVIEYSQVSAEIEKQIAEENENKEGPSLFGVNVETQVFLDEQEIGTENDFTIFEHFVSTEKATTLNFLFEEVQLPENSRLRFLDSELQLIQEVTYKQLTLFGNRIQTFPVSGKEQYIQFLIPTNHKENFNAKLTRVTYGYKEGNATCGSSGACNNPSLEYFIGDAEDAKRSVAVIIVGSKGHCTGTLVNNTKKDGIPYFITANHCLTSNTQNWVFGFHYDSCDAGQAVTPYTISGGEVVAVVTNTDAVLLKLNTIPSISSNVFYAGWDRSGTPYDSLYGIHHPSGSPKKVSFEKNTMVATTYQEEPSGYLTWRVNWDDGTTEGGSSGSGLFRDNGKLIGTLTGGTAQCSGTEPNGNPDYYGRFTKGFNANTDDSKNLAPWLAPGHTTVSDMDGYEPGNSEANADLIFTQITGIDPVLCNANTITPVVTLYNIGLGASTTGTVELNIDNVLIHSLPIDAIQGKTDASFTFPMQTLTEGLHTVQFIVNSANDANANNDTSLLSVDIRNENVNELELVITFDDYPGETSWEILNGSTVVESGNTYGEENSFNTITVPLCITEECYTFNFYDSDGDGICCDWGNGEYRLQHKNGTVLFGNSAFSSSSETHEFCVYTSIDELNVTNSVNASPNPFQNEITFTTEGKPSTISIVDLTGKVIYTEQWGNSNSKTISALNKLEKGLYIAQIKFVNGDVRSLKIIH